MRTNNTSAPVAQPFGNWFLAALLVTGVMGMLLLMNHASGNDIQRPVAQSSREIAPAPQDQAETLGARAALYREKCMKCHGKDGKGGDSKEDMPSIPDFSDAAWQKSRTNAQLSVSILDGKGKQMPSFSDRLKADQVKALLTHIRALGPGEPPPDVKPPDDFDEQFRRLAEEMQSLRQQLHDLHEKR